MKKTLFVAILSLLTLTVSASTTWKETCGSSVSQSGSYWPYTNAFTGYDHQGECTYDGWNSTVRYLSFYSEYGPHVYMAGSKDCRFSIAGIPGGEKTKLSFDIVCYLKDATTGTYEKLSLIGLKINDVAVSLPDRNISSNAFTTISMDVTLTEESNKIEFTKAVSVTPEVRLDNFTITYEDLIPTYTLTLAAGQGGKVNAEVSGEYEAGQVVHIAATPNDDYLFVQWSDGNTDQERDITISQDSTLTASFKRTYNTVDDLMAIYKSLKLAADASSTDTYTARGFVTKWYKGYPDFQNGEFYVDVYADGSKTRLECFRLTASNATDKRKLKEGEYVEFTGKLQNYNGRAEVVSGTYRTLIAPIEEFVLGTCYSQFEGMTGVQILDALHEEIKDPDTVTYADLRADKTGVDYRDNGYVWDMYTDCSFGKKAYCQYLQNPEAECECYNREHLLPQSWWGNDNTQRMRTDLFNVIPADAYVNEKQRSNWPYGEVIAEAWSNTNGSKTGTGTYGSSYTVFEPADAYKGDIARVYFYMLTCYKDKNFTQNGRAKAFFTYTNGQAQLTDEAKAILLRWHREDPVSQKEINRNNGIANLQHNRNPFVDKPELVEYIWGKYAGKTYTCTATSIDPIGNQQSENRKLIRDGQLIILRGDKMYTITGQEIH